MLLAVLPDGKTGGKNTVLSSSFAYTWSRFKLYHHAHRMGDVGFVTKRKKRSTNTYELKRQAKRHAAI
jgi:hypothetical protein